MNLLIFLDLTHNPCKNFKFYSLQGQNLQIFICTYNEGKIFLILPITWGETSIPGLHWRLPPRLWPMSCAGQQSQFSVGSKKSYIFSFFRMS